MRQLRIPTTLLFILCISSFTPLHSNAQAWEWAKTAIGLSGATVNSITTDASGNVYVTGQFGIDTEDVFFTGPSGTNITFGTVTLTNTGGYNMFLVKYDSAGNVKWAVTSIDNGNDEGLSVTTDASGNIYVVGYFTSRYDSTSATITFGATNFIYPGGESIGNEMFLVKYDPSGNVIWAKSAGSHDESAAVSVTTDPMCNVFVMGGFTGTLTFGGITLISGSSSYGDIFLAKFDSSGNALWVRNTDASYDYDAIAAIADAGGNVYVTGYFESSYITFGTITLTNSGGTIFDSAAEDIFLVKYDPSGNVLWARSAGSNPGTHNSPSSITKDAMGNIYIAGYCYDYSVTFGSITLIDSTPSGSWDMFLAKYDSAGNALWARGATGNNGPTSLATDDTGNIYATGYFITPITFGTTTLSFNGGDTSRLFLVKYDSLGNVKWVKSANSNCVNPTSMATDALANVYVSGYFQSNTITFGNTTLVNGENGDLFLAKLNSSLIDNQVVALNQNQEKTVVYPNPTTSILTITSSEQITSVFIANLAGQIWYNNKYNTDKVQIDVADLPSGVYLVKINGSEVRKFAKR